MNQNAINPNSKLLVIKCGGSIINNTTELDILLNDITKLKTLGFNLVIVHGGGPDINDLCNKLNTPSHFVNGNRVTTKEVLSIAQMVLLGKVNCGLVQKLNMISLPAIGLSGHDGNLIEASFINQEELGYVGKIDQINVGLINELIKLGLTPVISPIGVDNSGNCYNINADIVAGEIASTLKASQLILLSDIDGFYKDFKDKTSLVELLTSSEITTMLENNMINGGMIPKLSAGNTAVINGVERAYIINGNRAQCLINAVTATKPLIGTTIIKGI